MRAAVVARVPGVSRRVPRLVSLRVATATKCAYATRASRNSGDCAFPIGKCRRRAFSQSKITSTRASSRDTGLEGLGSTDTTDTTNARGAVRNTRAHGFTDTSDVCVENAQLAFTEFGVDPSLALWVSFRFFFLWVVFGYVLVPAYATAKGVLPTDLSSHELALGVLFVETGKLVATNLMLTSELGKYAPLRRSDGASDDDGNDFGKNVKTGLAFGAVAAVAARLVDFLVTKHGDAVGGAVGIFAPTLSGQGSGGDVICVLLASCVIAPCTEELFFRGFLLQAVRRKFDTGKTGVGLVSAVTLVSATFAAVHFAPDDFPSLFACGCCFAGAALASEPKSTANLTAPITAHAMFNASVIAEQVLFNR